MSMKPSKEKNLTVPDPGKKTYVDEQGRKYWFATGYYGRSIKMYGDPWKFRVNLGDVIVRIIVFGLMAFAIYGAIFGK